MDFVIQLSEIEPAEILNYYFCNLALALSNHGTVGISKCADSLCQQLHTQIVERGILSEEQLEMEINKLFSGLDKSSKLN